MLLTKKVLIISAISATIALSVTSATFANHRQQETKNEVALTRYKEDIKINKLIDGATLKAKQNGSKMAIKLRADNKHAEDEAKLKAETDAKAKEEADAKAKEEESREFTRNVVAQAEAKKASGESTGSADSTASITFTDPSTPTPQPKPTSAPSTITVNGYSHNYADIGQGGGQSYIDSAPGSNIATWGGASVNSTTDGMSTHIIGHNPGAGSFILGLGYGQSISVVDRNGAQRNYIVTNVVNVNKNAIDDSGNSWWDRAIGAGGGEQVVFQTCINPDGSSIRLVFAR